jgi:hypothetical protein
MWVMLSVLNAMQPIVVAHATSARRLGMLIRFSLCLVAPVITLIAMVALTPVGPWLYHGVLKVDNPTILALIYRALMVVIPFPLFMVANLIMMGLHTRSGRTGWVTAGTAAGLGTLLVLGYVVRLDRFDGAVVAVAGYMLFHVVSVVVQAIGLAGPGAEASLSRRDLSEQMVINRQLRTASTGRFQNGIPG